MGLSKLLKKQLQRFKLDENSLPSDLSAWQQFLDRIDKSYLNFDQERYLLERSMDLSSKEMQALNDRLEFAQHLAKLGYWFYDIKTNVNTWTKELYQLFKLNPENQVPTFEAALPRVHEDYREMLATCWANAIEKGEDYDVEILMRGFDDTDPTYNWYHVIGRPDKENGLPVARISGIAMDITRRKKAEEELTSLHQQLMSSARRAGMADVATSILHNVGNILNSAKVSISCADEILERSYCNKLKSICDMLSAHKADLGTFIVSDEKGKLIPDYLQATVLKIAENEDRLATEIHNLKEHLEHIKDITTMQKSLSGVHGLMEKLFLPEVIDAAIKMCGSSFDRYEIQLLKEYSVKPFIESDKSKLLQILVNLLQNAREAFQQAEYKREKIIIIAINPVDDKSISLTVKDNAIGIEEQNLTNVFAFGFTTKKDGHGFGLHSSSLAAKEIGGSLTVESEGKGCGAKFILNLPLVAPQRRNEDERNEQPAHYSD